MIFKQSNKFRKYVKFVLNAYVEKHKNLQWCPGRGCENAVQSASKTAMVRCDCGLVWCFGCKLEGHWPAACEHIKWYRETHKR